MGLPEFEDFEKNPTVETAIQFGMAITRVEMDLVEKNQIYELAYDIAIVDPAIGAAVDFWSTASMMEGPWPVPRKVMGFRDAIKNPHITPVMIEEWAWLVWEVGRIPSDLLDFIAIDVRNVRGITIELRRMLGHPNPEHPFRNGD